MDEEVFGRLLAHRILIERLVRRLARVKGFESMGLVQDLNQLEAQLSGVDLPDRVIEGAESEMAMLIEAVQRGRSH